MNETNSIVSIAITVAAVVAAVGICAVRSIVSAPDSVRDAIRDAAAFAALPTNVDMPAGWMADATRFMASRPDLVAVADAWCDTALLLLVMAGALATTAVARRLPKIHRRVACEWVGAALLCAAMDTLARTPLPAGRVVRDGAAFSSIAFYLDPAQGPHSVSATVLVAVVFARRLVHVAHPSLGRTIAVWTVCVANAALRLVLARDGTRDVATAVLIGLWVTRGGIAGRGDRQAIDEACKPMPPIESAAGDVSDIPYDPRADSNRIDSDGEYDLPELPPMSTIALSPTEDLP